jgi:hypothetical protein
MNVTEAELDAELERFGEHRIRIVSELAQQGTADGIGTALVLALGSRETHLTNIVGDDGHGRGWLQIDDRLHASWLNAHAGCKDGTWVARYLTALPPGRVPTLTASITRAIDILDGNLAFAEMRRVPQDQRLRFAIAAYNCGPGNAMKGLVNGGVDSRTAGHDYSADVLARQEAVARFLARHNVPA